MKSSMILLLTNSKTMKWVGHVARYGEKRNAQSVLVGNLEGKKDHLEKPRLGSEHNITIKHKEIESEGVDWSYLAEGRDK
jgi:hypothetical protein